MAATKTIVGETLEVRFVIIMPIERLRRFDTLKFTSLSVYQLDSLLRRSAERFEE